jgi:DNA invertase Pin-like site-specific DNA recombinase
MNPVEPFDPLPPGKIRPDHRDRWAIVYVRQSHPQQVERHRESAEVQANLRLRARQWGWPAERIRVLDGDQGCSGASTVGRDDFAYLLSEIALGHVGLVLGFQINRLAREDEACCRLIKTCATFDTLLADQDGVYHPHDFNDRMILTLKGFMGGFELHQLQQRMQAGRRNRVERGDWLGQPPPGYIVEPDGKLQIDPDQEVQQRVRLVFEQFAQLGSLARVLRYLRQQQLPLPFRPRFGSDAGQLFWRPAKRESVRQMLRHPAYAGAFTWGRRAIVRSRALAGRRGTGRVEGEPEKCQVFRRDNHPAYISWHQHQAIRERLKKQRRHGPVPGPARTTQALLPGLVFCGRCGSRMQTHYARDLRYLCHRRALDEAAPICCSFAGEALQRLIREQVLQVVTPAGLELSLQAVEACERERARIDKNWQLRLERARHETQRAFRQYNAVEPENRLVARSLERAWEEKLRAQRELEEQQHRVEQAQPLRLSATERAQIEALAVNLPALWDAPATSILDQRQVVRLLLERVTVWTSASSPLLKAQLHWAGGAVTEHAITRTLASWKQRADLPELLDRVRQARLAGKSSRRIAEELNAQGERTPHDQPFTAETVRQLLSRSARRKPKKKRRKPSAR